MSLYAALGSYDNLHEETPFFNHKAAAYGFVIPFLALTWVTNVGVLILYNYGLGQHFVLLDGGLQAMRDFVMMFWWINACYNMSMTAIKLSILFQYLRLLNDQDGDRRSSSWVRLAVIVLICITSIWGLVYSILAWVPSLPISADWDFTNNTAIRYGYGSDDINKFSTTFIAHGATNMTIDIAMFAIPLFSRSMWITAGRQTQSRIAMVCLYGLGIISVICSIVRFVSLVEHKATTSPTFDPTWYGPESILLSVLEVDIATIVASLPVFWPYLRRNLDRIMVTHEIEVKVTENFTQIDDQSDELGRPTTRLSQNKRPEHNACAPWEAQSPGGNGGAGLRRGSEPVLMRDLGRKRTGDEESGDLGDFARSDTPMDGPRSPGLYSPSKVFFLNRDSKEGLLR